MASVGLLEIPKVVNSTHKGQKPEGGTINHRGYTVFPVMPQKPWVNQFVAHLRPLVAIRSTLARHADQPAWTMYIASTQPHPQNPGSR